MRWSVWSAGCGGVLIGGVMMSIPLDAQDSSMRLRASPPSAMVQAQQKKSTPARTVTLDVRDSTLESVIHLLARQGGFKIVYDNSAPQLFRKKVTVTIRDAKVLDAFDTVLKGTGLAARLAPDGTTIMIRAVDPKPEQQSKTGSIHGVVVDSASGAGLANVTVSVSDLRMRVLTQADGSFILQNIPIGTYQIALKFLGYSSKTVDATVIADRTTTLRVTMTSSASILSGVVTTATGTQRKLEVGHTVTTINVDSIIKTAPVMSVTDILESRVPGMTIQRTSGTPGDPARIRIRGAGSITQNNDPIIVVDGVRMYSEQSDERNLNMSGAGNNTRIYSTPSPLDQIDVNTIETIEVLKGPSASAMYGSDGANGVIVITTKRGQPGPARWTVSAETGMTYQPGDWPTTMFKWTTPLLGGVPRLCVGFCGDAQVDSVVMFQALNNPYLSVLGRGSTFGSSANVSGGSQTMTYNFSASVGRERGILKLPDIEADRYQKFQGKPVPEWIRRPDLLTRRGGQGSVKIDFSPTVGLTATTQFNQTQQHRTSMSSSTSTAINELQGRWVDLSQLNETPLLGNPYERVRTNINTLTHAVSLRTIPVSWLPITSQIGVNTITTNTEMKIDRGLLTTDESGGVLRGATRTSSTLTGKLNTIVPVADRINLSAGMDFRRENINDLSGAMYGIPIGVSDPSEGEDTLRNRFSRTTRESVSFGWWLEPRFNLQSRFFVMPGFRLDNNGLSGKNAKLNGLPKMNLSWVVSEEPYFPWKDLFQMVRVRTAFGVSGVQPRVTDQYRLYQTRVVNPLNDPDPFYGDMLQLFTIGNTRIRPERVRELEGGIDIELLQNRISLELTQYRTLRHDAIVSDVYASSIDGGGSVSMNVGDIVKHGTELSLQAQIVERARVAFHLGMTFDQTTNKVLRLTSDGDSLASKGLLVSGISSQYSVRYRVGYPVEGTWMNPILGYADLDEDGWISPAELVIGSEKLYIGTTEPKYKMTFHPRLSLFRGRLNAAATVSYIHSQLQTLRLTSALEQSAPFVSNLVEGPEGFDRQVAFIAFQRGDVLGTYIGYSQHVNVTRLQSVSVSANLGQNFTKWVRARNASIALQGSNLGLWTSYLGVDPNVNTASAGRQILDSGQQPEPRVWQLRISLGY